MAFPSQNQSYPHNLQIEVWDLKDKKPHNILDTHIPVDIHRQSVNALAISQDGRLVASLQEHRTMQIWDLPTGEFLQTLRGHNDAVNALAINSNGTVLISGSDDHTVRTWDLTTGQMLSIFTGHQAPVHALALSSDGRVAISGADDRTLRVWNVTNGNELAQWVGDHPVIACALAAHSPLIIAVGDKAGTTYTLQLQDAAAH